MPVVNIKILGVESGVTNQGAPAWYITYKVLEWPKLGPFDVMIPRTFTKAQAQAKINDEVKKLALNIHEFYGITWAYTF